jgi:hypothetical protein
MCALKRMSVTFFLHVLRNIDLAPIPGAVRFGPMGLSWTAFAAIGAETNRPLGLHG